jgi:hypothetical protein
MTARLILSYGSNFTRPLVDLLWVTSTSWLITFPWWSVRWGTNGTYEQLGNKYDLQRIRDARDEPLCKYIR